LSAVRNKNERDYWSKQLDGKSAEEVKASGQSFLGIDTDAAEHIDDTQGATPPASAEHFTMWEV
jgi:hypothetical protein